MPKSKPPTWFQLLAILLASQYAMPVPTEDNPRNRQFAGIRFGAPVLLPHARGAGLLQRTQRKQSTATPSTRARGMRCHCAEPALTATVSVYIMCDRVLSYSP